MNHTLVSSSNLRSVGYDREAKILEIRFHDSGTYVYYDVSEHINVGLMRAGSKGGYFAAFIKDRYSFSGP